MLTPKFEIKQTHKFIELTIHAPYTKVSDVEITMENESFLFFAKPYLLRLAFPGHIQEDGSSSKFDAETGNYIIQARKLIEGQHFSNLDLLTILMVEKKTQDTVPSIEIYNEETQTLSLPVTDMNFMEDVVDGATSHGTFSCGYGFANKKSNLPVQELLQEVAHLRDLDSTSLYDRQKLRVKAEEEKFDENHYLADLYETNEIDKVIQYVPWWFDKSHDAAFSAEEQLLMQSLPNREYLLNEVERRFLFLGLVDVLFGYAYNNRVTEGENNLESSWNIRTLSSTLCWFHVPSNLTDVVTVSYRRSLCYPQHRNWNLCNQIRKDVAKILELGRRCVLRCLLGIRQIFHDADGSPCYLLNDLYITDYCVWIQKEEHCDAILSSLSHSLKSINISKKDVGFEIDLIEEAAELVLEEENEENNDSVEEEITSSLSGLVIN